MIASVSGLRSPFSSPVASTSPPTSTPTIKSKEYFNYWDFTNPKETKELYLTHNLIADKAGFGVVYNVYSKDEIIKQLNSELDKKITGLKEKENEIKNIKTKLDQVQGELDEKNENINELTIEINNKEEEINNIFLIWQQQEESF